MIEGTLHIKQAFQIVSSRGEIIQIKVVIVVIKEN